jgi:hypothetical protein
MDWITNLRKAGDHATQVKSDLQYFSRFLRIRPKVGSLAPFVFNTAQSELHRIIEEQRRKTGRVRVVVLKARQLGVSTYVAGRFYHRTVNAPGLRTIILGHKVDASRNLFQIVKRFHDHLPDEMRPSIGVSNAEELIFDKIDSGYLVTVATTEGAGRSATAQMLHASETAFWPDLETQWAAVLQTIPDMDNTEVIVETTANGYNDFYKLWRKAEAGESEFEPVFLPWSIAPEYRARPPEGFEPTGAEKRLMELHGLDLEQICWRRNKVSQLGGEELFAQEYPLTASEAFIAARFDSFISPTDVLRARKEKIEPYGDKIMGFDPSGGGSNFSCIAIRQGHCITHIVKRRDLDTMQQTGWMSSLIDEHKPARVNIDVSGVGMGVFDRAIERHGPNLIRAVNGAGKPTEPPPLDEMGNPGGGPANRRAETWTNMKEALAGRFSIPDRDSLQGDLTSVGYKYNSAGQLLLESKQDMRRRGVPSPDEGDAMALCFTEPRGSPIIRSKDFFHRAIDYKKLDRSIV